jgi:hypothetical protein
VVSSSAFFKELAMNKDWLVVLVFVAVCSLVVFLVRRSHEKEAKAQEEQAKVNLAKAALEWAVNPINPESPNFDPEAKAKFDAELAASEG